MVLSFDKNPEFLILYSHQEGGYVQYITPSTRYHKSTRYPEEGFINSTRGAKKDVTGKYLLGWGLGQNYDLTELILRKNTPFLNWNSFEPWDLKS